MTEAGADMFMFHVCVVVGGSNDRSWGQHVYVPCVCVCVCVCVVVGGSNDRSWG